MENSISPYFYCSDNTKGKEQSERGYQHYNSIEKKWLIKTPSIM
jgi:hypothetical protein